MDTPAYAQPEYITKLQDITHKLDLSLASLSETIKAYHYETVVLQSYIIQYKAVAEKKG